ncbi:MAG: DUF192 domain-containing protein [Polyangiales bacterium]
MVRHSPAAALDTFIRRSHSRARVCASAVCLTAVLLGCRTASSGEAASNPAPSSPLSAASASAPSTAPARVLLMPAGREPLSVEVEVVDTPAGRQQGLMYRKQLGADAGMLFIFDQPAQQSFWMRNTYLPLDIIFITADWTVLGIVENATPQTDTPRAVPGESQYVLEVNAGYSRRHGLEAGTSVRYLPASQGS